jgi:hypothetical protein
VQLQFYFDGEDRFQLRYVSPGARPLLSRSAKGGPAQILVGGNPMELAAGTLVSREAATLAARHFVDRRAPDPTLAWA